MLIYPSLNKLLTLLNSLFLLKLESNKAGYKEKYVHSVLDYINPEGLGKAYYETIMKKIA